MDDKMTYVTGNNLDNSPKGLKPQIVIQDVSNMQGFHNADPEKSQTRLEKAQSYRDLSTICVRPTRGFIHAKVVQSWEGLMVPMNQKFLRMTMIGMEVGAAYSQAIEFILSHPELSKWRYALTLEEDNMPPADGILKLYEAINTPKNEGGPYDVVQGIYWTKGEGGQPMIYGNPNVMPLNFIPQMPKTDTIQTANGLGMGFNLFRLDMFKDPKLPRPFFKTVQESTPDKGTKMFTQDLYFYENAGKLGYRFACDTRIKVGHYDYENDIVW